MSVEIVRQVKAELEARGVDLQGSCGAFEITKRVALRLNPTRSASGAGLLFKDWGNNCQGYAVGIICYPDGRIFDILQDDGGLNGPQWNEDGTVEVDRYRVPLALEEEVLMPPAPTPCNCQPPNLQPVLDAVAEFVARLDKIEAEQQALGAKLDEVVALLQRPRPSYAGTFFGKRIVMRPEE